MRLVTFRAGDELHTGVVQGEQVIDLSIWRPPPFRDSPHPLDMISLITRGDIGDLLRQIQSAGSEIEAAGALLPLDLKALAAPIPYPRKNIFCLGRNYAEHAAESRRAFGEAPPPQELPEHPMYFTKAPTSVVAPYADIALDFAITRRYDWEVEIAFVIGRRGKNIRRAEAMDYVCGYMVVNDISARDVQNRHGGQYFKGKSLDGTCPAGPWIVTRDEIDNPHNLQLYTRVNGVEKQNASSADMIFDIPAIIESLSEGMTLEPGDIVATGTPAGIGHARTPREYLKPGDIVECEVEQVGVIRNRIVGE